VSALVGLLSIAQATTTGKRVAWFEGDDDDAPGWRTYLLDSEGRLVCPAAPPRLSREMAEADLRFCWWENASFPCFAPPLHWPGRQYGLTIEDCGPDSIFGVDVPEKDADGWCEYISHFLLPSRDMPAQVDC